MEIAIKKFRELYIIKKYLKGFISGLIRYTLLVGLVFIIIYPLIVKLSSVFMSYQDLFDRTVVLIPRSPTLDNLIKVLNFSNYYKALFNTAWISIMCAVLQSFICALIGYGFAKFNFKGKKIVFSLVIFTMLIPPQTFSIPLYFKFKSFDILGILNTILGHGIPMLDTVTPMLILSLTGLAFKNGLYIFMLRQFFRGVPDELSEAATVDGAGPYLTYFRIILPLAVPMMLTVFLLSFSWQWTDSFYSSLFFRQMAVLSNVVQRVNFTIGISNLDLGATKEAGVYTNTSVFLVITPLIVIYLIAQRKFVQGIENSGIVG